MSKITTSPPVGSQTVIDLIAIYWHLHKYRLAKAEIYFASMDKGGHEKFDMQKRVTEERKKFGSKYIPVIDFFIDALQNGLENTLDLFKNTSEYDSITKSPHVTELLNKARALGLSDPLSRIRGGMYGGLEAIVQFCSLEESMPTVYNPIAGSMSLSQTRLDTFWLSLREIGVGASYRETDSSPYKSLDPNTKSGLKQSILKARGMGETFGCLASRPSSKNTRDFLSNSLMRTNTTGTMNGELSILIRQEYSSHVSDWFKRLSESEKDSIDPVQRRLLEGKLFAPHHEEHPLQSYYMRK